MKLIRVSNGACLMDSLWGIHFDVDPLFSVSVSLSPAALKCKTHDFDMHVCLLCERECMCEGSIYTRICSLNFWLTSSLMLEAVGRLCTHAYSRAQCMHKSSKRSVDAWTCSVVLHLRVSIFRGVIGSRCCLFEMFTKVKLKDLGFTVRAERPDK